MKLLLKKAVLLTLLLLGGVQSGFSKLYVFWMGHVMNGTERLNCYRLFVVYTEEIDGKEVYVTSGEVRVGINYPLTIAPSNNPSCPAPYVCQNSDAEQIYTDPSGHQCLGPIICDNYEEWEIARNAAVGQNLNKGADLSATTKIKESKPGYFRTFPNPVSKDIQNLIIALDLSSQAPSENCQLEIFDLTGRKVFSRMISTNQKFIEIRLDRSGVFNVILTYNGKALQNQKILVQ